jgi:hypothetical protein
LTIPLKWFVPSWDPASAARFVSSITFSASDLCGYLEVAETPGLLPAPLLHTLREARPHRFSPSEPSSPPSEKTVSVPGDYDYPPSRERQRLGAPSPPPQPCEGLRSGAANWP